VRVASNLRDEDWAEIKAQTGLPAQLVLPYAATCEDRIILASGVIEDGLAEILWGFDPIPDVPDTAVCWVVSTPRIYDFPQRFTPVSKVIRDRVLAFYPFLTNYVDERNERHVEWLRWLGAKFIKRIDKFGYEGVPFLEFMIVKE
jgi:hypothetical protein